MQLLHGAGALLQAHVRPRAAHQRTPLHISILQFARKPKIVFEVLKRGTQIVAGQVRAPEVPTRLCFQGDVIDFIDFLGRLKKKNTCASRVTLLIFLAAWRYFSCHLIALTCSPLQL
jgi:hypothetical protein